MGYYDKPEELPGRLPITSLETFGVFVGRDPSPRCIVLASCSETAVILGAKYLQVDRKAITAARKVPQSAYDWAKWILTGDGNR